MMTLSAIRQTLPVMALGLSLSSLCDSSPAVRAARSPVTTLTGEQWWRPLSTEKDAITAVGDADGDGHADILYLNAKGPGTLDISRTSPLGKPLPIERAVDHFGSDALAGICGHFVTKAADFLAVFADGSIRVAWAMKRDTGQYLHNDLACQLPPNLMGHGQLLMTVGEFQRKGEQDVVLRFDDKIIYLKNAGTPESPKFVTATLSNTPREIRQIAAGVFDSTGLADLVWLDPSGSAYRAKLAKSSSGPILGKPLVLRTGATSDTKIAVGRFTGSDNDDIVVGRQLFLSGDPGTVTMLETLPTHQVQSGDVAWLSGSLAGNGRDDLIRLHRGGDQFGENDIYIHFSRRSNTDKGYFCSSNDGIPDVWKQGTIKPGGLDLSALGCTVGHRDLIVEISSFDSFDRRRLAPLEDKVKAFYADLPLVNPDGTRGIDVHVIQDRPWPEARHAEIVGNLSAFSPKPQLRGIAHGFIITPGGGVTVNGSRGPSLVDDGWAGFVHEFGHQLGLRHDGYYLPATPGFPSQTGCALYPSLMSYSYSYSLDGSGDKINYSDGARSSFKVNQLHLSKHLPFPIQELHFLSTLPYRFRIKSDETGKGTYVDWNWDGLWNETDVSADINYTHGADCGPRYLVDKCDTAPVVVAHGSAKTPTLLLFYGKDGVLELRTWKGVERDRDGDKWSDPTVVSRSDILSDPTAANLGDVTWVTYPTTLGAVIQSVKLDANGNPVIGEPILVPDSKFTEPTLASLNHGLVLVLWRRPHVPLGIRIVQAQDAPRFSPEIPLKLESEVPVAAVAGAVDPSGPTLWMSRMEKKEGTDMQVVCLQIGPDQRVSVIDKQWVSDTYALHRSSLLWRDEPGMAPMGRLYVYAAGPTQGGKPWSNQVLTINTPYKDFLDGWLARGFLNTYLSPSAAGVCFFQDNVVYAMRSHEDQPANNDALLVSFYGTGATPGPMGDFNDIARIRDTGLRESIPEVFP